MPTAHKSLLIPSRADLAALISMTMGRAAAATYRAGDRFAPNPGARRSAIDEASWHPATHLTTSAPAPARRPKGHDLKDERGSAEDRRRRKQFLLDTYGDGHTTRCAFCKVELTWESMTVDRFPIPGRLGGRYTRDNIRPACGPCNSEDKGRAGVRAATTGAKK